MMKKTEYSNIGETVYEGTLENGLRIRVVPRPGFSSFYAVFGTKYGGAMRRFEVDGVRKDTPAGVAHFLEHKMFDLPNGDNALNMLSANGADPNAFTSSGLTCYYFDCTEKFEENLRLLLHFVSTPYFTPETVQKEQGIIGQEIRMVEDNPASANYYSLLKLLFDHHPIRDEVAGSIESIAQITDETLYDCHKVFYAPSNMCLCVEGDVDPERIRQIAEEELPKELSPVPHADYGEVEGPLPRCRREELSMEVSMPQFLIGCKINDSSIKARYVGSMCMKLLFGNSSPFYNRLYEDGTLNADFDAEVDYSAGTSVFILGGSSLEYDKVYDEMIKEIENVSISDEYFRRTKNSTIGSCLGMLDSFRSVCLSLLEGVFDGYDSMEAMKVFDSVTKEDCMEWIKDNLSEEKMAFSIVKPSR